MVYWLEWIMQNTVHKKWILTYFQKTLESYVFLQISWT